MEVRGAGPDTTNAWVVATAMDARATACAAVGIAISCGIITFKGL